MRAAAALTAPRAARVLPVCQRDAGPAAAPRPLLAARSVEARRGAAAPSTRAADAAYEELRGEYNFDKLEAFFSRRPWEARGGARGARTAARR
jgi:hypothetical protein